MVAITMTQRNKSIGVIQAYQHTDVQPYGKTKSLGGGDLVPLVAAVYQVGK